MTRSYILNLRGLLRKAAENLSDADAVDCPVFFTPWETGVEYEVGNRRRYGDKLYKCRQAHTSQAGWEPDVATSLWTKVEKPGQGDSPENPIPYDGNMELFAGKYYSQDGVVYVCTRNTEIPVYNPLSALVGLYVEVVS